MMDRQIEQRITSLRCLVGNTPLLEVNFTYKGKNRKLYAKAENLNMTGSIKDRMALHILQQGYESGNLKPGDHLYEATSGNTGIAVAAIGRALGHPVTIFMPDWMSSERINLIKSLGAAIRLVSKEEGGFLGSIDMAETSAKNNDNSFLPRQFSNANNVQAHFQTTGPEIWWQLRFHELEADAFVAGVGTGGTVMGTGRFLRAKQPGIKLHPLEPSNSPTLSTGCKVGKHRIQGISDEFIPAIVDLDQLDEVIAVDDGDAIIMAQKLAAQLGIGVGISSGANFLGALKLLEQYGDDAVIVTVFSDDNKKYLSTDMLKEEPVKDGFMSPHVELDWFRGFKRVCQTCCDPEECAVEEALDYKEQGVEMSECPKRDECRSPVC
jgi:cysteine synthase A